MTENLTPTAPQQVWLIARGEVDRQVIGAVHGTEGDAQRYVDDLNIPGEGEWPGDVEQAYVWCQTDLIVPQN